MPGGKNAFGAVTYPLYEYPPALVLWDFLRQRHGPDAEFALVPRAIERAHPTLKADTTKRARNFLIEMGYLDCIYRGGRRK